jgi:hypothetical protein
MGQLFDQKPIENLFPKGTSDKTMHAVTSGGLQLIMRDLLGFDMPQSMLALLGVSLAKELADSTKKGGKFDAEDIIANFAGALGAEGVRGVLGVNKWPMPRVFEQRKKQLIRGA